MLSLSAAHILNNHYKSPVNLSSESIIEISIEIMANLINSVSEIYSIFQKDDMLTLGLDDTLSSHANTYEKYLYFLGQRYKS